MFGTTAHWRWLAWLLASAGTQVACGDNLPGVVADASISDTSGIDAGESEPVILVGAGDIAQCSTEGLAGTAKDAHELTAELVLAYPLDTPVFTAGDNVYSDGTATEFQTCYDKSWGQFRGRTYPAAGNHDYRTAGASGYYGYFGDRAGDPSKGYYSYRLGDWKVIVLNSNCSAVGGCDEGSPQMQWLAAELDGAPHCTMAIWHHPRFSSGTKGTDDTVRPFYQALYDAGAELAVVGHAHNYERFAPMDADGNVDSVRGVRQLIVGTGGAGLRAQEHEYFASELFHHQSHGIVEFSLYSDRYSWRFIPTEGEFTDSGTSLCH